MPRGTGPAVPIPDTSMFGLSKAEAAQWQAHFGVFPDQILHDYVISRALEALSPVSEHVEVLDGWWNAAEAAEAPGLARR